MQEIRCPEAKFILAGDEIGCTCTLVDKWCLREHGYDCEEYNRIVKELEEEEDGNSSQIN